MLDLTWKVFCMTGNVDTYLLYKEMKNNNHRTAKPGPDADMKTRAWTNMEDH